MKKPFKEEYEKNIFNLEEFEGADIKINPDFYIHNALLKAQASLVNPDMNIGFMQFRILIENIEILARSAKMLPDGYNDILIKFKEEDKEYNSETEILVKSVKLANKKLELIMNEVFRSKVNTNSLKM